MNEKWSDFEKHVFKSLSGIEKRLSHLEGKVLAWGAIAGVLGAALCEIAVKAFTHT